MVRTGSAALGFPEPQAVQCLLPRSFGVPCPQDRRLGVTPARRFVGKGELCVSCVGEIQRCSGASRVFFFLNAPLTHCRAPARGLRWWWWWDPELLSLFLQLV